MFIKEHIALSDEEKQTMFEFAGNHPHLCTNILLHASPQYLSRKRKDVNHLYNWKRL